MTAPVKPWESGINRMSSTKPLLESGSTWDRSLPVGVPQMALAPPPLPARRPVQTSCTAQPYGNQHVESPTLPYVKEMYDYLTKKELKRSRCMSPEMFRYGGYNSYMGFNPYGYSNPYGRRMMGMGMMPDDYDSRMMQVAEESCQALFGPLDSLVRSVSSIAMVLDSTMQAMQMSFRTVVSAADSLSRLKSLAVELASGLSLFAVIGNFFRRIFRMLGLIKGTGPAEKEWAAAAAKAAAVASASTGKKHPSAWPAVAFFALMMGGPYLMFRMFSQLPPSSTQVNSQGWTPSAADSINVTALYDFEPMNPGEMPLRRGDQLVMRVGSASNGWVLVSDGSKTGYAPLNRLARHGKKQTGLVKKVVAAAPNVVPPEIASSSCAVPAPEPVAPSHKVVLEIPLVEPISTVASSEPVEVTQSEKSCPAAEEDPKLPSE